MNDSPVQVRLAALHDAALLAALGAKTFRDTFEADNTESDMVEYLATAFSPVVQTRELRDECSAFLIAHADGTAVGYARLRFGESRPCIDGRSPVEIARLYADKPWIGHGVGTALMQASLELTISRGCDVVWLDVWERNYRALAFYAKWGFKVVGEQLFRLGTDLQNDLLMARPLNRSHPAAPGAAARGPS